MKKAWLFIALGLFVSLDASAAMRAGQCVFPKTIPGKNSGLAFKNPVYISSTVDGADKKLLGNMTAFTIKAVSKGFIQLATVPDWGSPDPEKDAGKIVGWAKASDFVQQELRNCN